VTFTPAASGALTAAVSIADNAVGSPQTVPLAGTVTTVALSPASLTYPTTVVGVAAATQKITLTNDGTTALSISTVSITGTNASSFSQTNTCGSSVAVAGTCVITVGFTPAASGPLTAAVSIADSAIGSPQTVALTGGGTTAVLAPAAGIGFATTPIGANSPTRIASITNKGTTALSIASIGFTGIDPGSFSQTNTCGTSVAAGGYCYITITFTPAASGGQSAALSVADSAYGSPQTISLGGQGTAVSLSPASLTYASTAVGTAAPTQQITLTNKGATTISFTGITITGTDASSFSQTNTCGSSVAAAASCAITVTFTPAASGALTAAVSIADNAVGSPQTVALTGTGQ
jgi:methionine-rich copper-binding protein CopC